MNTGMLWFDNDPNTALATKVANAAHYYQMKYGRAANLCMVNPSALGDKPTPEIPGITIQAKRAILPGHLWLGTEEKAGG